MGRIQFTVTATNKGDVSGSASVEVFNIVPAVAASCGPGQPFGELRYSVVGASCNVAVCERGGVSVSNDAVHLVPPSILQKWLTVKDRWLGNSQTLGCPVAEAMDTIGAAQQQDFERGRIYDLRTGSDNVFYVSRTISDAIDVLGGQAATGLPLSDPLQFIGMGAGPPTWYFQRFRRPGARDGTLDSTLEIRGDNPVLTVERQGGDLSDFSLAELQLSAAL
jgi:hypothetical protein